MSKRTLTITVEYDFDVADQRSEEINIANYIESELEEICGDPSFTRIETESEEITTSWSDTEVKDGYDYYDAEMRADGFIPNPNGGLPEYIKVNEDA